MQETAKQNLNGFSFGFNTLKICMSSDNILLLIHIANAYQVSIAYGSRTHTHTQNHTIYIYLLDELLTLNNLSSSVIQQM